MSAITVTSPTSEDILKAPWTQGSEISARLRLATKEEKELHRGQQSGGWWYVRGTWHFMQALYNGIRMYRNMNLLENIAPWVGTDGKYHFEHRLPGRVAHCFYHPTAMEAIFKHARSDEGNTVAPFVEKGDVSKQLLVDIINEIFPDSKINSEEFILSASLKNNRKLRKSLHAFFNGPKIRQRVKEIHVVAKENISKWVLAHEINGEVNLNNAVRVFTSEIISKLFIGVEGYNHDLFLAVDMLSRRITEGLLKKEPNDPKAWEKAKEVICQAVNESISQESTFAQELLSQGLSESEVRAMIFTLYLGGYETTATSLINTLLTLAQNPDKQREVIKEMEGTEKSVDDYRAKDYPILNSVLHRSLKELNPAYGIGRQPRDDLVMEIEEKDGSNFCYYISKNEKVIAAPAFAAQEYGDDDPSLYQDSLFWYPFGHGKHACPGKELALSEMVIFITQLLSKYELTTTFQGKPTQVGFFVNSIQETVKVQLIER